MPKVSSFFKKLRGSYKVTDLLLIALTMFVFIAIPLTVLLVNKSRDDRTKAAISLDKSKQYQMPVLVLSYLPTRDGVNLDSSVTGINSTLSSMRSHINQIKNQAIQTLENGSRYHAYGNNSVPAALDYSIYSEQEYLQTLPLGLSIGDGLYRPDYRSILNQHNICSLVENQGVKEVWLFGWHYGNIVPAESNMAGPLGDISNSERSDDMPVCAKTYVLYNYNYGRGASEAVHNHGHQIEVVMKHFGDPGFEDTFIGPWETYGDNDGSGGNFHRCGWTHEPPNSRSRGEPQYDYTNTRSVWTDCEDWKPDGSGQKKYLSCSAWGCNELGYHTWRWQSMPGLNNTLVGVSNWWDFIGDIDQAKSNNLKLVYDTTPPAKPTGLDTLGNYSNSVTIVWPNPATRVDYYLIRRNNIVVGRVGSNKFTDFTVTANTNYSYTAESFNEFDIGSGQSNPLAVTTPNTPTPALTRPIFDAQSSSVGGSSVSQTWNHTTGPYVGKNNILVVGVAVRKAGSISVSSVTYANSLLTKIGHTDQGGVRTEFWRLTNPSIGTNNIKVTFSASPIGSVMGATSWFGVSQTNPTGTFASQSGVSANPALTVTTSSDQVVVDVLAMPNLPHDIISSGSSQTSYLNLWSFGDTRGVGSYKNAQGASTTMSWTGKWEAFAHSAVPLNLGQIPVVVKQGDINKDGEVGSPDLAILLSTWGSTSDLRGDLNSDRIITSSDLAIFLSLWGT